MAKSSGSSYFIIIILLFEISANIVQPKMSIHEVKLHEEVVLQRERRQLLFPNTTLLQFNAGVGTPTPVKTININWAFQANFQLPWNRTQIPLDILNANSGYDGDSRKKRNANETGRSKEDAGSYGNDASLHHFYKYVEDYLNGFGHNGTECVLRALCQLGAEPLHSDDDEDLLHELACFVLNPNNDADQPLRPDDELRPYIEAHYLGARMSFLHCTLKYSNCSLSVIDMFSKLHDSKIEY